MSGESKVAVGDMKELSRWGWVVGGGGSGRDLQNQCPYKRANDRIRRKANIRK